MKIVYISKKKPNLLLKNFKRKISMRKNYKPFIKTIDFSATTPIDIAFF